MGAKIFVVGGGASGKSAYAERVVRGFGKPKTYIATLQPYDDEMRDKVIKHRSDRGPDWTTVEAPMDLTGALTVTRSDHIVLIDCMTLWLTNVMLAERDVRREIDAFLTVLTEREGDVVIVSNEVGMGIVPDNALARRFRNAQGGLNQRLAAVCDPVVTVIAGLPLALKGDLPAS